MAGAVPQKPEWHHIKADAKTDFKHLQKQHHHQHQHQMPSQICVHLCKCYKTKANNIVYTSGIKKWTIYLFSSQRRRENKTFLKQYMEKCARSGYKCKMMCCNCQPTSAISSNSNCMQFSIAKWPVCVCAVRIEITPIKSMFANKMSTGRPTAL